MSLYVMADTHLSLSVNKPMDIFDGWADYQQRIKKNWEKLIEEKDTVVIPGDICWAMDIEKAVPDFKFLNDLPGTKIIGKGNHDYWWTTMKKMENFMAKNNFDSIKILHHNAYRVGDIAICGTRGWFYDAEQEKDNKVLLREAGRLRMSIEAALKLGGEPVVFLHYPPVSQTQVCEEIYNVLLEYNIKRCYYGHLHSYSTRNAFNGERDGIKFSLISSDYLGFMPSLVSR